MNARGISFSLLSVLLLCVVLAKEPVAFGAGDQDRIASLERRIATLEKEMESKQQSRELALLTSRVANLERTLRDPRQGSSYTASTSQRTDVSQLKRENAEVKRDVRNLEVRVTTGTQNSSVLRRELDQLRSKVSTLENAVDRLKR